MGRRKVTKLCAEAAQIIATCKANGIELSVYEMTDDRLQKKQINFSPFVCRARKPGSNDDPLVTYATTPEVAIYQTHQNARASWPESF
jgi:hypothetical protein